jgi:hypothetical protein
MRLRRPFSALLGLLCILTGLSISIGWPPIPTFGQLMSYLQSFDGSPSAPQPYAPPGWDVQVHSRDESTWQQLEPMTAQHGMDCAAPPSTHPDTGDYASAVFLCRDHVMTSISAGGYGVIYLTPPVLADWSNGEAVIRWDMSTLRTSQRDWVDVWISPYDEHLALPLGGDFPDLVGTPRRFLHFSMDQGGGATDAVFRAGGSADWTRGWQDLGGVWEGYNTVLTPDAARRDTFEIHVSRTHVKVGMPAYNLWWHDVDIPTGALDWTQGVIQFGHHSYNPSKCDPSVACAPNTWHWDNVSVSPAVPFTIERASPRQVRNGSSNVWTFQHPAPAGARLQFSAVNALGDVPQIDLSWNDGATWQTYTPQPSTTAYVADLGLARNYWVPVPVGATHVLVRGQGHSLGAGTWQATDASVWIPPSGTPAAPTLCTPRPNIGVTVVPSGPGQLRATLTANTNTSTPSNQLWSIQLTRASGAVVQHSGGSTIGVPAVISPPVNTSTYSFFIRDAGVNQAATVALTVVDSCGPWSTFVGAGTSGFSGNTTVPPPSAPGATLTLTPILLMTSTLQPALTPTATAMPDATRNRALASSLAVAPPPPGSLGPAAGGSAAIVANPNTSARVSLAPALATRPAGPAPPVQPTVPLLAAPPPLPAYFRQWPPFGYVTAPLPWPPPYPYPSAPAVVLPSVDASSFLTPPTDDQAAPAP